MYIIINIIITIVNIILVALIVTLINVKRSDERRRKKEENDDLSIYGDIDASDYTLVQLEIGVLVKNSQVDKIVPTIKSKMCLVQHEIIDEYDASTVVVNGEVM